MPPGSPLARARAVFTARRQIGPELLMGLSGGALQMAMFVAIRAFDGPDFVAPLIVIASQLPWLFAPALDHLLRHWDKQRTFFFLGLWGKLPLLAVGLMTVNPRGGDPGWSWPLIAFVAVVVLHNVVFGLYIAHRGALLRANYDSALRGRMFAWFEVAGAITILISGNLIGWALDANEWGVRIAYPLCGLAGIVASVWFSRIAWRREPGAPPIEARTATPARRRELVRFWRRAWDLLRGDARFRRYEIGFFLYGMGFLASVPLVAVLGEGELGLSYGDWASAQSGAFPIAFMVGVLFFGRLSDRLGPVRISAFAFALLAMFFVMMTMADSGTYVIVAFLVYGLAMSGVSVGWNLGPLWFAPPGAARRYSSAHVFLVGVRSVIGPALGYAVAVLVSLQGAFVMSAAFVALGAFILFRMDGRRAGRAREDLRETGAGLGPRSGAPTTPTA